MKRVTVDFDPAQMGFSDLHRAMGAITTLQELATTGAVGFCVTDLKWSKLRKQRSDAKGTAARPMQPQTLAVLNALVSLGEPATVRAIAKAARIDEQSARGQLNTLLKLDRVERAGTEKVTPGKRGSILWKMKNETNEA